jgi:hypothetical protein
MWARPVAARLFIVVSHVSHNKTYTFLIYNDRRAHLDALKDAKTSKNDNSMLCAIVIAS